MKDMTVWYEAFTNDNLRLFTDCEDDMSVETIRQAIDRANEIRGERKQYMIMKHTYLNRYDESGYPVRIDSIRTAVELYPERL